MRDCHEFAIGGVVADLAEASTGSELFRGEALDASGLVPALNVEEPVSPVVTVDGAARVQVLSWGAVAAFVQRHVGARLSYEAGCYERTFGMPERTAAAVAAQEETFGGLMLFPLEAHRLIKPAGPYQRHAQAAARR